MSHITIIERREIYEKRLLGVSFYQIAKDLKRPTKTIIAEYKRNKVATHGYEPIRAQEQVDRRKSKPRVLHKFSNPAIKDFVVKALEDDFSPEQISGRIESDKNLRDKKSYVNTTPKKHWSTSRTQAIDDIARKLTGSRIPWTFKSNFSENDVTVPIDAFLNFLHQEGNNPNRNKWL
jgi:IS30 family transposase